MQLCIFEDIHYENLEPLIFMRPTCDIICGITSLKDKILLHFPEIKYSLHCRQYLEPYLQEKYPDVPVNRIDDNDCLFINGRVVAEENFLEQIDITVKESRVFKNRENIVAARLVGEDLAKMKFKLTDLFSDADFTGLPVEEVEVKLVNYMWDVVKEHSNMMLFDYKCKTAGISQNILGEVYDGAYIVNKSNVFIAEGAVIKPGAVLDASKGPIYIDKNAIVFPNAVIEGPVYVGESSQIKGLAYIYDNVSVGKVCKLGGEVEYTVVMPYTNKQHAGFIGHAYLGSWVNLGADTNCSDLKNNYGSVRMYVNGEAIDTGHQFLGVVIGDHTKVAINSMFNTGTVVGFACNVFGAGFPGKSIPSFSWGGPGSVTTYDLERSIETAKRVMLRRNYKMSDAEEMVFRKSFDMTRKVRKRLGYPY